MLFTLVAYLLAGIFGFARTTSIPPRATGTPPPSPYSTSYRALQWSGQTERASIQQTNKQKSVGRH